MTPAVSVVIPCYNLGAYLDEAVRSVLDQTYEDFEVLIVDDGSDDPVTRHLLASYERPRTRIMRTENQGLGSARNTGLAETSGAYVSFLDADDVLAPRFLERTIGRLEDDSIAFASCWLTAFGEKDFRWQPERCDFPWLLAEDTVCTAAPVRREALEAVGGFDETGRAHGYEDWDLAISLVESGFPGVIVPERLFRYRIRPGSMSSGCTRPENHARVVEYMLEKHEDTYRKHIEGVLDAIARRTDDLERGLVGDPPPRPRIDREDWRASILALENHRRGLEERLEDAVAPAPTEGEGPPPVEWGALRRLEPVSRVWGIDRGQPIDRYYIERFLKAEAEAIVGNVLEVKDPGYTKRFGSDARSVTVVDVAEQNPDATLIVDLAQPRALPLARYDCFVLTQTIHFVFDVDEVLRNVHRTLAPGGVVLATLPCVSRIDYESGVEGDFWRFTTASARRLFEAEFGEGNVRVESFGNVLACTAFLHGLAVADLHSSELDRNDPYFPLLLAVRAQKPSGQEVREVPTRGIEGHLDEVTCTSISGWAWDAANPAQRLRVDVRAREQKLGSAWCDQRRDDLAESGKGGGRVAFRFEPDSSIHEDPPAQIDVAAGDDPLVGSPQAVRCVCGRAGVRHAPPAPGLRGADLDTPESGARLAYPTIELAGWVVGEDGPVESVELLHRGELFCRVPVETARPDIEAAFPDVDWAGRAGFASRLNLAGSGGELKLEVQAVLPDGARAPVASVVAHVADPPRAPVVAVLDSLSWDGNGRLSLLDQRAPASQVLVRTARDLPGHPGFAPMRGGWNQVLGSAEGTVIWLCSGQEAVTPEFLGNAVERLADHPQAAFVTAVDRAAETPRSGLTSVLSATALGYATVFRASAVRVVGGIDESATTALMAQWDLAVRLAEAEHEWVEIDGVAAAGGETIAESADEDSVRWLYRKHASLYRHHLRDVLLEREASIGQLLRSNHLEERALESELRPRVRARRRERDRLTAKLRDASTPKPGDRSGQDSYWGDFHRLEPFSPLWGSERGLCVDRYYIERFLQSRSHDVRGRVLECDDSMYATRYGGGRLERCDVLDLYPTNPNATIVADLQSAPTISSGTYDCVLLTQVLQSIEDPKAALAECRRILKPGGVLLATVPCAARIDDESGLDHDHWRFTADGLAGLLAQAFPRAEVDVRAEGNRTAVLAFLAGLAAEEVGQDELDAGDPSSPLVITCRALVPAAGTRS